MSKGGLAAGTAPNRIGADRNGAPVEEIDVGELYKAYDPVGLQKRWYIGEVARVVTAHCLTCICRGRRVSSAAR